MIFRAGLIVLKTLFWEGLGSFWFKFKLYLVKLAYLQKRSRLKRYGLPILLAALILLLNIFLLDSDFLLVNSQAIAFLVFILVVTASSWYGGLGPGILATVITSIINYFTLLRGDLPFHPESDDILMTLVFMVVGFFIGVISEARYEVELQKDEFIALLAHETKNPLSAIKGFAGLLHQSYKKNGKSKVFRYTEEIDFQSNKLLELVNDLLDVTKIEVGKFAYKDELFDFDSLVKKVIGNQGIINTKREITLSGSSKRIIKGDAYRIGQAITNLLTNAIKYSPEESPVRIRIKGIKSGVLLSVRDYGIGIPKSEQRAVFNQFYRSRRAERGKSEGLGLGLFISSQIIRYHHGKLWVKSNGRRGSTFYLEIPKNYY